MNPRRKKRLGIVLAIFFGISATVGLMVYRSEERRVGKD